MTILRRKGDAGGEGKDSNLRYDLHRITPLVERCLRPLSHLSNIAKDKSIFAEQSKIDSLRIWFAKLPLNGTRHRFHFPVSIFPVPCLREGLHPWNSSPGGPRER